MTASTLSRLPAYIAADWSVARIIPSARLAIGAVFGVVIFVAAFASGTASSFDPAALLLFTVVVGASIGGRRGGVAAAAVTSLGAFVYYAQPAWVETTGNATRVLLLVAASGLIVALVGSLREVVDLLRTRIRNRRGLTDGVQAFSASVVEAADDSLFETIVAHARRLVDAEVVVLTVLDPRTGRHVVRATDGTPGSALGVEVLPGVGITGQAIRDRHLVTNGANRAAAPRHSMRDQLVALLPSNQVRRADADAAHMPPSVFGPPTNAGIVERPLASVPAMHAGRVAATLTVGRSDGKPGFSGRERLALDLIAPIVALSIGNWTLRRQLRETALRDPLSGLYNRAYFDAALEQMLALRRRTPAQERRALSVVLFDLDDFRGFNQTHGRKAGDAVVRSIGALLRQRFRASDLIARVSGDAFIVVLDGAEIGSADQVATEIRARVHGLVLTDEHGNPVRPSISAGCATFGNDAERSDAIIRAVEAALDTARWSGPGAIVSI